jgi:glycosyltransferase involved in cell wall biosynthesis
MFGGTLTLARRAIELVSQHGPPDVVLASDMLDLPSFLGHAGTVLSDPKTVLYMHENQLTYPISPTARDDLAYAYINWSSMVRADEVWFNSQFHLDSLFEELPKFLRHFPDHRHSGFVEAVRQKSSVLPVGVELGWIKAIDKTDPPLIIWNQRWEYDKDPVRLFNTLARLSDIGTDFRLAICGENFRNIPDEFEEAQQRLDHHLIHYGYAERDVYERLLLDASVVISTAKHEFFGVAAVEAMAAGAVPVFPRGLSYPELVPEELHDETLYESDGELDDLLSAAVRNIERNTRIRSEVMPSMGRFSWETVAPAYDRV